MQIILLKKFGKFQAGVNNVKNGFGRYLIAKQIALTCTEENIQTFNSKIDFYKQEQERLHQEINKLYDEINEKYIFIIAAVNETGNLYGKRIKAEKIVTEIKDQLVNSDLITNQCVTSPLITRPGIFQAKLNFGRKDMIANVNIVVAASKNLAEALYLSYINESSGVKTSGEPEVRKGSKPSSSKKVIYKDDETNAESIEQKKEEVQLNEAV